MTMIRSMQDLMQARNEAAERTQAAEQAKPYRVRVGTSSCGIAAGAAETFEALCRMIAAGEIEGVETGLIRVEQIGCIGLCALEPVVQVDMPGHPPVTYGRVTPEVARRILVEQIGKGIILRQYEIENV